MKITASIICVSYNQKIYIKQALDSFISQQTNFPFVAIVADDCSTDGTTEIIKKYATKYPDIIKPIFRDVNIGANKNFLEALNHCNSQYIAICDGDDYWIDNHKLQKQVDFLENNPDYSICFHSTKVLDEVKNETCKNLPFFKSENPQSLKKLLYDNFIPSNTVMYRFLELLEVFKDYPNDIYPCDWFNHIACALKGKIGFIDEVMSVYRRNQNGISFTSSKSPVEEIHLRHGMQEINFYYEISKRVKDIYPEFYKNNFFKILHEVLLTYCKNPVPSNIDAIKQIKSKYEHELKDISIFKENDNCDKFRSEYYKYKNLYNIFVILCIILFAICVTLMIFIIK